MSALDGIVEDKEWQKKVAENYRKLLEGFEDWKKTKSVLDKVLTDYEYSFAELPPEDNYDLYQDVRDAKQELVSLRSRIAELEALTQWQPIETAPLHKRINLATLNFDDIWAKEFYSEEHKKDIIFDNEIFYWASLPNPPDES